MLERGQGAVRDAYGGVKGCGTEEDDGMEGRLHE